MFFQAAVMLPQFSLRKMTTSFTEKLCGFLKLLNLKGLTFSWNPWRGELLDLKMAAIFYLRQFWSWEFVPENRHLSLPKLAWQTACSLFKKPNFRTTSPMDAPMQSCFKDWLTVIGTIARMDITPRKTNIVNPNMEVDGRCFSFSNRSCSGSMLVFGGIFYIVSD